ncbi:HMG-Y-related protein A-like [Salvia miltiorrhiza]|uniref:HMG-Y-related protein A-like n=1 Tax=Salvia miltiorrhiza TaxID=226208 RepID=UPI0025AC1E26|nr:HMG-Y-related protein A-like [Salvia miltiorrhiza]
MATEELTKPSSLPPYPQMIMEAIDAVKEADGANKSTISKYMESKYGELGGTHTDLLNHHLTAMKDSGELVFVKNNYLRPSSDAPPKRGRGRPPKPKDAQAAVVAPSPSPRPRGRPKKDPNAPPAAKKAKSSAPAAAPPSGRPRGRPKKVQPLQNGVEA